MVSWFVDVFCVLLYCCILSSVDLLRVLMSCGTVVFFYKVMLCSVVLRRIVSVFCCGEQLLRSHCHAVGKKTKCGVLLRSFVVNCCGVTPWRTVVVLQCV